MLHNRCARYLCCLLLLASMLGGCGIVETRRAPAPAPSTAQLRAVAADELQQLSFSQTVQLGEPYEVCNLPYSALDRYRDGTRLGALIECNGDRWRIPMLANGSVHSTIDVAYSGTHLGASGVDLHRDLQALVAFAAKDEHKDLGAPVLFRIDPLFTQFALFNKGFDEQILVLNTFESFKDDQAYPTRDVMPQIIKAMDSKSVW